MELPLDAKNTRLYVRRKTPEKRLIEKAAMARGMNISDYILSTVLERSVSDIQRQNRISITEEAFEQLQAFLLTDPDPSAELVESLGGYQRALKRGMLTVAD